MPARTAFVEPVVRSFITDIVGVIPKLLTGAVFLVLANLVIRFIRTVLRSALLRVYADEQEIIVDLGVTVVTALLWFGAALALKEMLGDTVAGVYLLQDADFNEGDRVTTASFTARSPGSTCGKRGFAATTAI